MNDQQIIVILVIIKIIILGLISVGTGLYALLICFIRRLHTPVHLLSLNVCIAAFICALFWTTYFIMNTFYTNILWTVQSCIPILYIQTTVNCQVLYALCMVSLNRLFTVVYSNNALFRTKKWIAICVSIQWIFAALIPLPTFASSLQHCFISGLEVNYQIYTLIIIGVLPAILLATTNGIIYSNARRSTRRVRPVDGKNTPIAALTSRDAHLLKHMIFIFTVFFCGWVPMYIIGVINWNGNAIPYVVHHGLTILPGISSFIDVIDLYLYNHELRKCFTKQPSNNLGIHAH